MSLKKTSCGVGMHFGKLRDNSVKIENYKNYMRCDSDRVFREKSGAFR